MGIILTQHYSFVVLKSTFVACIMFINKCPPVNLASSGYGLSSETEYFCTSLEYMNLNRKILKQKYSPIYYGLNSLHLVSIMYNGRLCM